MCLCWDAGLCYRCDLCFSLEGLCEPTVEVCVLRREEAEKLCSALSHILPEQGTVPWSRAGGSRPP